MSVSVRPRKQGRGGLEVDIIVTLPDGRSHRERVKSPVSGKAAALRWGEARARHLALHGPSKTPAPESQAQPQPRPIPTLAEFVPELLAHLATVNRETTLRSQRSAWTHHLLPALGHLRLDEITAREVDRYVVDALGREVQRRRERVLLDSATIGNHLAILTRALKVAQRWRLIEHVPEIHAPGRHRSRGDARGTEDFRFLAFAECDHYLATAREHAPQWSCLLLFAVRTGLRLGELIGLDWSRVDLDRQVVRVDAAWTREAGFGATKSGRARDVPLTGDAARALTKHRREQPPFRRDDGRSLVFPHVSDRARTNTQGCIEYQVGRIAKLAGVEHVTPHDLRHTFASHCVMRGIPLRQVQEWLGHSDSKMTERYSHLAPDFGASMIERLSSSS